MTDDERAIRTLVDSWMAASGDGDIATVLSLMADDAIFMVPGQSRSERRHSGPPSKR